MRKTAQRVTEEETKKRQRKKKTKQTITRAGTHIRLIEALKARCLSAGIGSRCEPPAEIAKSWRTNRHHAYEAYREDLADYAQANVVVVEKSEDSTVDYWLRISTLDKGNPLRVPVTLASYHQQTIAGRTLNSSTTLHQHQRDRQKRRRKAKLRACLEKKGMPSEHLPSTSSATGQRLGRFVRQEINRAVNKMIKDHPHARII